MALSQFNDSFPEFLIWVVRRKKEEEMKGDNQNPFPWSLLTLHYEAASAVEHIKFLHCWKAIKWRFF